MSRNHIRRIRSDVKSNEFFNSLYIYYLGIFLKCRSKKGDVRLCACCVERPAVCGTINTNNGTNDVRIRLSTEYDHRIERMRNRIPFSRKVINTQCIDM